MDPSGCILPDDQHPETVFSITNHFTGHWFLLNLHFFCLVITEKRIICINTDDLLAAHRKETSKATIPFLNGPPGGLIRAFPLDGIYTDFSSDFRHMTPSAIAEKYAGAVTIPVNGIDSFAVRNEYRYLITDCHPSRWTIEIIGRHTTIRIFSRNYPAEIVENANIRQLFGSRFLPLELYFPGEPVWMHGIKKD